MFGCRYKNVLRDILSLWISWIILKCVFRVTGLLKRERFESISKLLPNFFFL